MITALALLPGLWGVWDGLTPVPRGLNDAGGEFVTAPWDPTGPRFSSPATLDWMARSGFKVVRLPFRWEQLQPRLGGPLHHPSVERIRAYLEAAHQRGLGVILDPHNYARYQARQPDGGVVVLGPIGTPPLTQARFADFWARMARALRGHAGLYGYSLMNEPHDIVTRHWEQASQAAVEAIRAEGDDTLILVPGSNYASAYIWVACHGQEGWIRDPLDRFVYEAHCYFDQAGSGRYDPAADPGEGAPTGDLDPVSRTEARLAVFGDWCEANGVRGFLGEFGCPPDPRWLPHLKACLEVMDARRLGGTAWAAGEAWPLDYPLRLQPDPQGLEPPQLALLKAHPGTWAPRRLAADLRRGYRVTWLRARHQARRLRDHLRALREIRRP